MTEIDPKDSFRNEPTGNSENANENLDANEASTNLPDENISKHPKEPELVTEENAEHLSKELETKTLDSKNIDKVSEGESLEIPKIDDIDYSIKTKIELLDIKSNKQIL